MARVAEGHHEAVDRPQAVDHRIEEAADGSEVDLGHSTGGRLDPDDGPSFRRAQMANEALDRGVAAEVAVVLDEALVNGRLLDPLFEPRLDQRSIRLDRRGRARRRRGRTEGGEQLIRIG